MILVVEGMKAEKEVKKEEYYMLTVETSKGNTSMFADSKDLELMVKNHDELGIRRIVKKPVTESAYVVGALQDTIVADISAMDEKNVKEHELLIGRMIRLCILAEKDLSRFSPVERVMLKTARQGTEMFVMSQVLRSL